MKILKIISFVLALFFLTACWSITTTLESDLFEKTMTQTSEPQLVDVRTLAEYNEGHLRGAILIDIRQANFDSQIQQLDRERPVFVYCRSGKRSLQAATILEKNKFKIVYNLEGGIIAWKNKGYPVEL